MDSRQGLITLQGKELPYQLVRVRSRKRVSLLVNGEGLLQVRTPWRTPLRQVEQLVCDHETWILQQLSQVQQTNAAQSTLPEGHPLPLLDGFVQLRYGTEQIRPIIREDNQLWVAARYQERSVLTALLEQWYRAEARRYLPLRLQLWSDQMQIPYARLTVRSQKSRWGSCSSRKTISLNWRLVCLPVRVGDYVMVHELSHLRHMNHSPDFWGLVARYLPEYVACRQQLRLFLSPW